MPNRVCSRIGKESLASASTRGMALIAVDAVVNVAGNVLVVEVVRVVASMAARALEDGVIV